LATNFIAAYRTLIWTQLQILNMISVERLRLYVLKRKYAEVFKENLNLWRQTFVRGDISLSTILSNDVKMKFGIDDEQNVGLVMLRDSMLSRDSSMYWSLKDELKVTIYVTSVLVGEEGEILPEYWWRSPNIIADMLKRADELSGVAELYKDLNENKDGVCNLRSASMPSDPPSTACSHQTEVLVWCSLEIQVLIPTKLRSVAFLLPRWLLAAI